MLRFRIAAVIFVYILFSSTARATALEIASGSEIGGLTFQDLAVTLRGTGFNVIIGFESFPFNLGQQFADGHVSQQVPIPQYLFNGVTYINVVRMQFDLFMEPNGLLAMSAFDPGVEGTSVSEPFAMTGFLFGQNFQQIDFVGQGTLTAGWGSHANNTFADQYFAARFESPTVQTPEPSSLALLIIGILAIVGDITQF